MGLKEDIMSDIKLAMKAQEKEKLTTLRFIHAAIKNEEINARPNEISEQDIMGVLKKLAKRHQDSIDQFQAAKRTDLVEKEQSELAVVKGYLPTAMGRDQMEALVAQVISETKADSLKQMGQVMKEVIARSQGTADNKAVSELIKAKLSV